MNNAEIIKNTIEEIAEVYITDLNDYNIFAEHKRYDYELINDRLFIYDLYFNDHYQIILNDYLDFNINED